MIETHGLSATPEYHVWFQMIRRCHNEAHPRYKSYGARGVYVCRQWRESVAAFINDMGRRPSPRHSLDRIDNNGPYSPENCRWALSSTQQNNRRDNRCVTYRGVTKPLGEWVSDLPSGISLNTLYYRIFKKNWPIDRAFTEAVHAHRGWADRLPTHSPLNGGTIPCPHPLNPLEAS